MGKRMTDEEFKTRLHGINDSIIPLEKYVNSNTKILFECVRCGHQWETTPDSVLHQHGCPECAKRTKRNKLKKTNEQFLNDLKIANPNIMLVGVYSTAKTKTRFKCLKCKNEWDAKPNDILSGHGCPKCGKKNMANALKMEHAEFLEKLADKQPNIKVVSTYYRSNRQYVRTLPVNM